MSSKKVPEDLGIDKLHGGSEHLINIKNVSRLGETRIYSVPGNTCDCPFVFGFKVGAIEMEVRLPEDIDKTLDILTEAKKNIDSILNYIQSCRDTYHDKEIQHENV